ncbi:hypothetical protein Tco_1417987 [Tanacetum coccineum]
MRTRSQARRLRQQQRHQQQAPPNLVEPPKDTMVDNRTMAELLHTMARHQRDNEDAIVVPEISHEQILRSSMGGLFSRRGDRFKDLLRACPHHGFSELHQLDTFYNALNVNDQDSLNSAAGGNFLDKRPADCSSIIESKSKVRHSTPEAKQLLLRHLPVPAPRSPVKAVEQSCVTCGGAHSYRNCPATDSNNYRDNIQEYVSQAAAANFNQGNSGYRPPPMANQIRPLGFPPMQTQQQPSQQSESLEPKPKPWEWPTNQWSNTNDPSITTSPNVSNPPVNPNT